MRLGFGLGGAENGSPLVIQLVAGDVGSAQTTLQYSIRSAPKHGTLLHGADGYRPPQAYLAQWHEIDVRSCVATGVGKLAKG